MILYLDQNHTDLTQADYQAALPQLTETTGYVGKDFSSVYL